MLCTGLISTSFQQKVLLVAVRHVTPPARVHEYAEVSEIIDKYNPKIICIEFSTGDDTASLFFRYGNQHFENQRYLRKLWKIPESDLSSKIVHLQKQLGTKDNITLRMELHNLYLLSSDYGNAQYQGYQIMQALNKDSSALDKLRSNPGFYKMKGYYNGRQAANSEFTTLIFPFAASHHIDYVYPIDDLSTVTEGSKHSEAMPDYDSVMFYNRATRFLKMIDSLSQGGSELMVYNSPAAIDFEPFRVDWNRAGEDVKKSRDLWLLRNKLMAENIAEVAAVHQNEDIVVFFGAAHVGAVRLYLNELDGNFQVVTLNQVK